ncbi:hypothetical protein A0H81_11215 [Grifola frondosa]|uniref:Uncharacterized protein n=1 Tax=Grifola frondosa TaxID=5627 RepID=A0A1C7LWC4_GRIFR|nr:hypothetical protein A0H81_11215 [Grifola frondosa]
MCCFGHLMYWRLDTLDGSNVGAPYRECCYAFSEKTCLPDFSIYARLPYNHQHHYLLPARDPGLRAAPVECRDEKLIDFLAYPPHVARQLTIGMNEKDYKCPTVFVRVIRDACIDERRVPGPIP